MLFPEGFIVLEHNGAMIGYGCSEKWRQPRLPALAEPIRNTHDPAGRNSCITGMPVRTAYWRQGHGASLLKALISIAGEQGCHTLFLETTHAEGFYRKFGFRPIQDRTA